MRRAALGGGRAVAVGWTALALAIALPILVVGLGQTRGDGLGRTDRFDIDVSAWWPMFLAAAWLTAIAVADQRHADGLRG